MLTLQKYCTKWALYGAVALFAYMPFHIFFSQWLSTFTGGLDGWKIGKDVFTALLTIIAIATVIISKKYTKLFWWILGLTVVYGLLHLILLFATDQPYDTGFLATAYNLRIFCYFIIGYSLALLSANSKLLTTRMVRLLIILSTVVCLVGLAQWLLPKDLMTHFGYSIDRGVKPNFFIDDKPDLPRIMSTIRDPNSLGAFLILPIVILLGALIKGWKTNRRMLLSGLLLLHTLALFLTFSRSAFLAALLAAAAFLAFSYRNPLIRGAKRFAIPLAVGLVLIIGGAFILRDQYVVQNVILHSDESTTLADPNELRVALVQKGIDGVIDDPEGHGPGTAGLVSTKLPNGLLTENYYLQIAYEVGLLGLLIFLGLLYFILKTLWASRKNALAIYLLASFAGLAFMNLLLHTWANEAVTAAWFLLTGLSLTPGKKN